MLWGKQFFMAAAVAAGEVALLCNEGKVGYCAPPRGALA